MLMKPGQNLDICNEMKHAYIFLESEKFFEHQQ